MTCEGRNTCGLSHRDRELALLGAAIASNCIPCIEYHVPEARKAGLSDLQIREAVKLAAQVRRVPAGQVLQTALALLKTAGPERVDDDPEIVDNRSRVGGCCG
jgi:4-carboxymuconolactone decarboxylase